MFDRVGEIVSVVLGALALGYLIYEIDRRKREAEEADLVISDEAAIRDWRREHFQELFGSKK